MLLPASVDDNVVTCHSAEHPCGASALRGLESHRALQARRCVRRQRARRGAVGAAREGHADAHASRESDRLVVMAAVVTPDPARWFTQHLRARAASLLAEYRVASGFEHKLLRGLEREAPIRRFLLEHCPRRVLVASGSVADASKVLERQHDIVLIDAAFGPTLLAGSAAALFPRGVRLRHHRGQERARPRTRLGREQPA